MYWLFVPLVWDRKSSCTCTSVNICLVPRPHYQLCMYMYHYSATVNWFRVFLRLLDSIYITGPLIGCFSLRSNIPKFSRYCQNMCPAYANDPAAKAKMSSNAFVYDKIVKMSCLINLNHLTTMSVFFIFLHVHPPKETLIG